MLSPSANMADHRNAVRSVAPPTIGSTSCGRNGALQFVLDLPAQTLLGAIWIYQRTLSPVLPVVLGPSCGCRFSPTCSHYAAEAVRVHGAFVGAWLTLRRLLKCTPLHPGGFDFVPPRATPRCTRLSRRSLPSSSRS